LVLSTTQAAVFVVKAAVRTPIADVTLLPPVPLELRGKPSEEFLAASLELHEQAVDRLRGAPADVIALAIAQRDAVAVRLDLVRRVRAGASLELGTAIGQPVVLTQELLVVLDALVVESNRRALVAAGVLVVPNAPLVETNRPALVTAGVLTAQVFAEQRQTVATAPSFANYGDQVRYLSEVQNLNDGITLGLGIAGLGLTAVTAGILLFNPVTIGVVATGAVIQGIGIASTGLLVATIATNTASAVVIRSYDDPNFGISDQLTNIGLSIFGLTGATTSVANSLADEAGEVALIFNQQFGGALSPAVAATYDEVVSRLAQAAQAAAALATATPAPPQTPSNPPSSPPSQFLTALPPAGSIPYGQIVYVNDGGCPTGQLKQVIGGNNSRGIPRQITCVPIPVTTRP
jgi:hypothetical protein